MEESVEEAEVVIKKRKNKVILDVFDGFNKAMTDGRLTEPSDGKVYRLREAIMAGCEYFITTDDRLLKYQSERINLVTPGEFIRRMEADR